MSRSSSFLAIVLLTVAGNVAAHDMFVMPDKFRVGNGETVRIGFHSADGFPDSTSLPRRLRDASSYTSNGTVPIAIKEDGKRMLGDLTISGTGHVLVSVINSANIETMKPPSFLEYMMAALAGEGAGKNQTIGKTDALGRIVVPVKTGKWRLHTIHMERASDSEADWESLWATLTFEVP